MSSTMRPPFRPEDLYLFRWLDQVRLDPAGEQVAYVLRWADREALGYRSRVYLQPLRGDAGPLQLTDGPTTDSSPEWAPDGRRLTYIAPVAGAPQLHLVDTPARRVTALPTPGVAALSPRWSPDGSRIAFLGSVLAQPEAVVQDPRPSNGAVWAPVARIIRTLDNRLDGRGFFDGRRLHLFVIDVASAATTQLTSGAWDVTGFDWSPDGASLVLTGDARSDKDLHRLTTELYVVAASGGPLGRIAGDLELRTPAWSPSGDLIAFVAPLRTGGGLYDRLWVIAPDGGGMRCVTAQHDIDVADRLLSDMPTAPPPRILWAGGSDRLYFQAALPGSTGLCSISVVDGGLRQERIGDLRVYDWDTRQGTLVFAIADATSPGDVHVRDGSGDRRITRLNDWFDGRALSLPERMEFVASDGWRIEGWLLKPPDFDAARKYPLVLEIHGAAGEFGWPFYLEFQVLASAGYIVFFLNQRGSAGYGEGFLHAYVEDVGGRDFADITSALDTLLAGSRSVDPARIGVTGTSYGGFMTNWLIGQTDRFRAAVSRGSVCDFVSLTPTMDLPYYGERVMGRTNWTDPDQWDRSPIKFVENIRTPLLLLHAEMDLRCPIYQAHYLFGALRLLQREVELVTFPEESHAVARVGRPDRRVEHISRVVGWFERHMAASGPTPRASRT